MSKGLEALKDFKEEYCANCIGICKECELKIIEQELKEGEKDHKLKVDICEFFGLDNLFPYDDNEKILKELEEIQGHYYDIQFKKSKKEKALKHIKETLNLKVYKNKSGQCFLEGTNILIAINQEKYDLLKEIML